MILPNTMDEILIRNFIYLVILNQRVRKSFVFSFLFFLVESYNKVNNIKQL